MYTASVLKAMLGQATTGVLPKELLPVDRIMQRWAVANGTGLPEGEWDDTPTARPPPLDDDTAMLVDEIVRKCPPKTRHVLVQWYRKPLPTKTLAEQMGMAPRSLETCWKLSLNFLKYRFVESNNLTLARLLRLRA